MSSLLQQAEAIFLELSELSRSEWESRLHERCQGDRDLMREVASLLQHHEQSATFLDAAKLDGQRPYEYFADEDLPADTRIDEFSIVRVLGRGGMGNVYVAQQDKPRRTVALKVIRRSLTTPGLLRRFEHEAEFLGRLQHPGIAQIYAAGTATPSGAPPGGASIAQPFIAMELVSGPPLNVYATDHRISPSGCMELVAKVCDAVQHAHQRGVIHRDLKPANILVNEQGEPKILDFGVARAADAQVSGATMHTRAGQIIGTLPYMSPEQVVGKADEIDTRSDVYALGVILYQLLAGRLPLDVSNCSIAEAARIIRDDSPRRLGQIDKSMRGDIETIAARAIEKDKSRRYQSAAELGADLRRCIKGEPVVARQDSALYVIRKQINRNRGVVAAIMLLFLGIAGFAIYASREADRFEALAHKEESARHRAEEARDDANRQQSRADAAAQRLARELSVSNIERGRLLGRSGNLAAAEDLLWPEHLRNLDSHLTFYALWELYSRTRCEVTLTANSPRTYKLRLTPDDRYLITTGADPAILVRDTETLETVASFGTTGVDHTALAVSADGRIATGDAKGRIELWNPVTGKSLGVIRAEGPPLIDLAFDRTGARLAAVHANSQAALFSADPATTENHEIAALPAPARSVAADPTSDRFVFAGSDYRVRIVSSLDLSPLIDVADPDDVIGRCAFAPDGRTFAAGGSAHRVRLWDASDGRLIATLEAPNGNIHGIAFSPDSQNLLVIGWWNLHVWDLRTQRLVRTISGHRAAGADIAVTSDGKRAWTNLSQTIRCWDLDPSSGSTRIDCSTTRTLVVFGPPGQLIAGEADGTVSLLSDPDGALITTLGKHPKRVRAITVAPSGKLAVSTSVDGTALLLDLESRTTKATWTGFVMPTNDAGRFNSTGTLLAMPAQDFSIKIVRVPEGDVQLTIPGDKYEPLCAAFSPDDSLLAVTTRKGSVTIYDAKSGSLVRELERPTNVAWTIIFTPDGSQVISGNWARSIDVWDVATGKIVRRLSGHRGLVTDLEFRPREPNILASAGADGQVMLWDLSVNHDTPVLTLDALDGWEVWALDFDPGGRRLIATNSMGTSVTWDLRHFNRHIGGNMAAWLADHKDQVPDVDAKAAMKQRALLLSRGRRPEGEQPPP